MIIVIVTFSSITDEQQDLFRGVLIQARSNEDDTHLVGRFRLVDDRNARLSYCSPRNVSFF